MTTEQCLLNPNRNPQLDRSGIENYLMNYLGVDRFSGWEKGSWATILTDTSMTSLASSQPDTIVCALEDDPADANYELLQDNFGGCRRTRSEGRPFEIVTLPMPGVVRLRTTRQRALDRLPASYANFYIANNVVLAPIFGHANDERALEILRRLFLTAVLSESIASLWSGAWGQFTASLSNNQWHRVGVVWHHDASEDTAWFLEG